MAQKITGTFAGTGSSEVISCTSAVFVLTFAGTATVNIEAFQSGTTWVTISARTASGVYVWNPEGVNVPVRLTCSAHTDNVTYAVYTR
jgi:hypothetical protein